MFNLFCVSVCMCYNKPLFVKNHQKYNVCPIKIQSSKFLLFFCSIKRKYFFKKFLSFSQFKKEKQINFNFFWQLKKNF